MPMPPVLRRLPAALPPWIGHSRAPGRHPPATGRSTAPTSLGLKHGADASSDPAAATPAKAPREQGPTGFPDRCGGSRAGKPAGDPTGGGGKRRGWQGGIQPCDNILVSSGEVQASSTQACGSGSRCPWVAATASSAKEPLAAAARPSSADPAAGTHAALQGHNRKAGITLQQPVQRKAIVKAEGSGTQTPQRVRAVDPIRQGSQQPWTGWKQQLALKRRIRRRFQPAFGSGQCRPHDGSTSPRD